MIAGILELQWTTDMVRLSNEMRRTQGVVGNAMGSIERSIAGAHNALARLGVGVGVGAMAAFANSTIGAVAALDDLSEKTGASVEELSKLSQVATIGGHATETYESALIRLGKAIHGADEESKGAGKALAALGLSAQELRGMDTAAALQRVAVELNKYADGSGKSALAMDLLGKSGAAALPFLKDLATEQGISARVTAEQAGEAERLQKELGRLKNEFDGVAQSLSMWATPAIADWIAANREAIKIAGGLGEMLRLFVFNLEAMTTERPGEQIRRMTGELEKLRDTMAGPWWKMSAQEFFNGEQKIRDSEKQIEFLKFLQRQEAMAGAKALGDTSGERFLSGFRADAPALDYKPDAKDAGDADAAYRGLLRTLKEKLLTDRELNEAARLQLQFESMNAKTLATLTPARRAELMALAEEIDARKRAADELKRYGSVQEALRAMQLEYDTARTKMVDEDAAKNEAARKFVEAIREESRLLQMSAAQRELAIGQRELETIGIQRGTAAWEDYNEKLIVAIAEKRALEASVKAHKDAAVEVSEFWLEAARSMQRNFSDFFFDVMQGDFSSMGASFKRTLDRMVADQLAASAAMSLFGPGFGKGGNGQLGGWVGGMLGLGGGAPVVDRSAAASAADIARLGMSGGGGGGGGFLSGVGSWLTSLIPFEAGTPFVPSDGPYYLHRGERVVTAAENSRGGGGRTINANFSVALPAGADRRTGAQIGVEAARAFQRELGRNTA